MKNKIIDDDSEHHRILFELGLLDDDDDWKLFQEQERQYEENLTDDETVAKYFKQRE
jgi:hypothetical protein